MIVSFIFDDCLIDVDMLFVWGVVFVGGLCCMGVQEGDVIGVLLCNVFVYIDVMYVCCIVGCYFCFINWYFMLVEVEFFVCDLGVKVLIGYCDFVDVVELLLFVYVQLLCVDVEGIDCVDGYVNWFVLQMLYDGLMVFLCGYMVYMLGIMGWLKGVVCQVVLFDQFDVYL